MPSVPRIDRATPAEPITTIDPEPVIARLHHPHLKMSEDVRAWLISVSPGAGLSHGAGLIYWVSDPTAGPRTDWIPAWAIRRPGEEPAPPPDVPWRSSTPRIITLEQSARPAPPHPGLAGNEPVPEGAEGDQTTVGLETRNGQR